eukprot:Platyproteum_vivax@DN2557_c0_g1_i1.p2
MFSADHTLNTLRYACRLKEDLADDLMPSQIVEAIEAGKSPPKGIKKKKGIGVKKNRLMPANPAPAQEVEWSRTCAEDLQNTLRAEKAENKETQIEHLQAVDRLCTLEDEMLHKHMAALQEDARMLTEEGELLSIVQSAVDYDIDTYVDAVSKIVDAKLAVYGHLQAQLREFKQQLVHEEMSAPVTDSNEPAKSEKQPIAKAGKRNSLRSNKI